MWSRLIFPDGSSLVLDNLKGADQSGYSGFKGSVNRHWGPIISSALLVSLLGAGVEIAAPTNNNNRDNNAPRSILAENSATAVAEAIAQIIQREANRQPTIKIKPGYRFLIFVQHDIIFPRVWHN
jgi:type IV secretion system protein VirB10